MFLLIESLFSTNSVSGKTHWDFWILFAGFFDTTDSSDSPCPFIAAGGCDQHHRPRLDQTENL